MRTLAIGDIHGCLKALDALLDVVQLQGDDLLVTLGDYVDRGPDSKGVLDWLIRLQNECRLVALKGNHEIMMLQACNGRDSFNGWRSCGGNETLTSYGKFLDYESFVERIPRAHWRFLCHDCEPFHETDTHFFVHANAHAELPLAEQHDYMLYWEHFVEEQCLPHLRAKSWSVGIHNSERASLGAETCRVHRHVGLRRWLADMPRRREGSVLASKPERRDTHGPA